MSWQPVYNRTNEPGTCLWCGRKLRKHRSGRRGDYGDNHFCGLRCGYNFGEAMAKNGRRLHEYKGEEDEPATTRYVYPKCAECHAAMRMTSSTSPHLEDDEAYFACSNPGCEEREWMLARRRREPAGDRKQPVERWTLLESG